MPDDARIDNGCSENYTAVPLVYAIATSSSLYSSSSSSSSYESDDSVNNSHNDNELGIEPSSTVDTEYSAALTIPWSSSSSNVQQPSRAVPSSSKTKPTQQLKQDEAGIDINGAVSYLQQMAKLIGPSKLQQVTTSDATLQMNTLDTLLSNVGSNDEDDDGLSSQGDGTNASLFSIMTEPAATADDGSGGKMGEDTISTASSFFSIATEIIGEKKQHQHQQRIVESSSKSSAHTVAKEEEKEEGGVKKKRQIKSSFISRKVSSSIKNKKNKQQQHDHPTDNDKTKKKKKKRVPKRSSIVKQFFSSSYKKTTTILPPVIEEEKSSIDDNPFNYMTSSDISHVVADVPVIETSHTTDGSTTNLRIEVVRDEKVMDSEAADHAKVTPRSRSKSIQKAGDTATTSRSRSKSNGRGNNNSAGGKKTASKESPHDEISKDVKKTSEQETTSKKFVIRSPIQLRSPVVMKSDKECVLPPDDSAKAVSSGAAQSLQPNGIPNTHSHKQPNGIPNTLSHKELQKMAIETKKAEKQRKKVEKQEAVAKAKADREAAKLAELKEKLALQEKKVQEASAAVSHVKERPIMKPSKAGETKKMTQMAKNAVAQAKAELKEAAKADREAAKLAELKGMLVAQEAKMDETLLDVQKMENERTKDESKIDSKKSDNGSSISSVGCKMIPTWTTDGSVSAYAVAPSVGQVAKVDNKTSGYKILKNSKHNIKLGKKGEEVPVPMEVLLEEESKPKKKKQLFGKNSKSFSEYDVRDDEDRDDGEANWDYSGGFHYTKSPGTPRDDNADGGEEVSDVIGGWISEVTNFVDGLFDATDTALIDGARMQEVDAMESMKRREARRLRRASKAKNPTIEYSPSDVKCLANSRVIVDDFADDESEESFLALARFTGMFS